MATMRDVAARAGVSQKTVSRVFNDDVQVRPETRERVQAAMQELGYVANPLATVFRSGKVPAIGIAVPDIADPLFAAIISAADDVARSADMSTLVTSLGTDPMREAEIIRTLLRRAPRGLVVAPVATDQSYLAREAAGMPIVFVDRPGRGVAADTIRDDDTAGAHLAVEHLVAQGHRRIAFVGDDPQLATTRARFEAYVEVVGRHVPELVALGVDDADAAREVVARLLALDEPPTAVFSSNARASMLLFTPVTGAGLGLVSFGDFPMSDALTPPVCAVAQNPRRMGAMAAQRVLDRMDEPQGSPCETTMLDVTMIERGSCRLGAPSRA